MRRYCSDVLWQLQRQDAHKLRVRGSIESGAKALDCNQSTAKAPGCNQSSAKALDRSFDSSSADYSLFVIACRYIKVDQYRDKAFACASYDARLTIISPNHTKTIYSYILICSICQRWYHIHKSISLNRFIKTFLHCCHTSPYINTYNEYYNNKYHGWQYNGSELSLYKMNAFQQKYDFKIV